MSVRRRYPEAKVAYQRVLQLDPLNAAALGFLGMVYHLMDDLDAAIVKYHEVSPLNLIRSSLLSLLVTDRTPQTLSIDPINGHILELLNLALESNALAGPLGQKGVPGGEEEWARKMREHRKASKGKAPERGRMEDHAMSI